MDNRKNNFDFLRLVFASFVIITHSYPLSGKIECDYLCQLTDGQTSFSYIGVRSFFVISGYLIFQSLERSNNIANYFRKRFLRLYPALIVMLLVTIIFLPLVYQGSMPFFKNKAIYTYILTNLSLYKVQYSIDGVFENNPYKSVINGSLWTLSYEFTMYVVIGLFIIIKNKKILIQTMLLISFLVLFSFIIFYLEQLRKYVYILKMEYLIELGIYFIAGSLLATINIHQMKKKELIIIFTILIITSIYFNIFLYSKYIVLPIFVITFGLTPVPFISNIANKIGDLSYGIYIYGFTVQQILMYYLNLNYLELMFYSLIISMIISFFSWHLIEKQALKFKKVW